MCINVELQQELKFAKKARIEELSFGIEYPESINDCDIADT